MTPAEAARAAYQQAQAHHLDDAKTWEVVAAAVIEAQGDAKRLNWMDDALARVTWLQKAWIIQNRRPVIVNTNPGVEWTPGVRTYATLRDAIDAEMRGETR